MGRPIDWPDLARACAPVCASSAARPDGQPLRTFDLGEAGGKGREVRTGAQIGHVHALFPGEREQRPPLEPEGLPADVAAALPDPALVAVGAGDRSARNGPVTS